MRNRAFSFPFIAWVVILIAQGPSRAVGQDDSSSDDLLISGRLESIYLHSVTGKIRENFEEHSRFYFNNIFLNIEGDLGERVDFIIEYQPLTSDLYLLGGFVTIAESLEGIGGDDADTDPRILEIDRLVTESIKDARRGE
jgi:hypothetical protein